MHGKDGRVVDVALAVCWIPFAAIGWLFRDDTSRTAWFVSVTLLISFAHQPLTLALVYGDKRNFNLRRRVFTWSPLVLAGAVLAAQHVSLTIVAVVVGLWNAEHTLMQRYGIMRMYGRKSGDHDGQSDKVLLVAWLVLTLVWVAADGRTSRHIEQAGIGGKNRRGLEFLADLRPPARLILPVVVALTLVVTMRWLWHEDRRGAETSTAKRFYVASTAALFVTILVNPVVGFVAFIGAHAIEYFVIVHRSIGAKYRSADVDGGAPVGYAVRRVGRTGFFIIYIGVVTGILSVLDRFGSQAAYTVVILTLGGMHVLYDGFIWKRPSPGRGGMLTTVAVWDERKLARRPGIHQGVPLVRRPAERARVVYPGDSRTCPRALHGRQQRGV